MQTVLKPAQLASAAILVFALAGSAFGQASSNRQSAQTDWSSFTGTDPKVCWAVSAPKSSVNTKDGREVSVRRGDILLFVTSYPGKPGAVSFTGGYPFAPGSTVTLEVSGTSFELFSEGEFAWSASDGEDAKIVAALKRGAEAKLSARSARGTITTDTFSLLGATAMIEDAEKRCAN